MIYEANTLPKAVQVSEAVEPAQLIDGLNTWDGRFLRVGDIGDGSKVREVVVGSETYGKDHRGAPLIRPVALLLGDGWCEDAAGLAAAERLLAVLYGLEV